ncbi:GLPGLI family protein [Psychroflexus tropicus]|uniref:GLPGLI family protein n=1 Tax=Psychroflexus tropicus TaxID=197345 RepID=UPI0003A6FAD4|nr:GLPGLI family protein [Psychroflexus tropicus]
MKKYVFIFFICLIVFKVKGQDLEKFNANYKVTYRLKYSPDSTNIDYKSTEDFYLFIGDNKSKFLSINKKRKDSIRGEMIKNFNGSIDLTQIKIPKTKFNEIIFKDYISDQIKVTDRIGGDVFLYTENIAPYTWEIGQDVKIINDFKVQKAITEFAGRKYVAWFTKEISIPEGPYKFDGLPGLIVQINDNENHYSYQLISFEKLKEKKGIEDFDSTKSYIKTTKKGLSQTKQDFYDNPIQRIKESGLSFNLTPQDKRRIKEKYRKLNNPIELQ